MAEANEMPEIPTISYLYSHHTPSGFGDWYELYAFADGTFKSPSNFDSLVKALDEQLSRPENAGKRAVAQNNPSNSCTPDQVAIIELLLNKHNERLSNLTAQAINR